MAIKVPHLGIILFFALLFFFVTPYSYAAIMEVDPQTKDLSLGETFSVPVKINGEGTAFNAAKATVVISSELSVENLTLGDCGFAYVVTPGIEDPSFVGVILGSSSNSCTVYTLDLKAESPGTGTIIFSDNEVKAYNGASEILSSTKGGSYKISSTQASSVGTSSNTGGNETVAALLGRKEPPQIAPDGTKLYNVSYTLDLPGGVEASDILVTIDAGTQGIISSEPQDLGDGTVLATFKDVPEGVHTITTMDKNGETLASETVNVSGDNREFVVSSEVKTKSPSWIILLVIAIGVVLLGVGAFFGLRFYKSRKGGVKPISPVQTLPQQKK